MSFGDDDEGPDSSYSSQERYTRADRGKKEELKKQIKQKMGAEKAAKAGKASLMSKMGLRKLKEQMFGKKDEETGRKEEQDKKEEKGLAAGTKTLKQEEEAQVSTAHDQIDPDTLIERAEKQEDVSDEETTPEPG